MSAVGGESVCESLVRGDVVTALSALLKEVQYMYTSIHLNTVQYPCSQCSKEWCQMSEKT